MARARSLKPGFFRNADLAELAVEARLLFAGLWTLADRAGRLEDRPKQIKMELYPADSFDVDALLNQLQGAGFILRYEVAGKRYIQVIAFTKHQNPHRDEKASSIPAPIQQGASTVQALCRKDATSEPIGLTPDSLNLTPDSGPLEKDNGAFVHAKVGAPYPDAFEAAWSAYPRTKDASKRDAFKAWSARVKAGATPEEIIAGVNRYSAYCTAMQTEMQYIKQPATFFGPGEHYAVAWDASANGARASPHQSRESGRQAAISNYAAQAAAARGESNGIRTTAERDITGEAQRVA